MCDGEPPVLECVAASTDQVSDAKNPLSGCLRKRILEELDRQTVVQLPSVGGYQIVTVFFKQKIDFHPEKGKVTFDMRR